MANMGGGDILVGEKTLLVVFKWSKTNQSGGRVHMIPLVILPGSPLCPVTAYKNMCGLLPFNCQKTNLPSAW